MTPFAKELLVAIALRARCLQIGFRASQDALGIVERGLIWRRIDLIEHLPLLHIAAFREEPLQHNPAHPRPDFRHSKSRRAPGQIVSQHHRRGRNRQRAHFHRPAKTARAAGSARFLSVRTQRSKPRPDAERQWLRASDMKRRGVLALVTVEKQE